MTGHWDLDELRDWIGREVRYVAPEPIGRSAGRYFALAIGDDNPIYTDDAAARAAGLDGIVVPPTWLAETNQYVTGIDTDEHGYRGHAWDLPVTGCRQIRGGNSYSFHRHARPDDLVTAVWSITSVDEKVGRDGTPMLLVGSQASYLGTDGDPIMDDRETLIYQPVPA